MSEILSQFPTKPRKANHSSNTVKVITNLYKLNLESTQIQVSKYQISTEPEIPDTSKLLRKIALHKECREHLNSKLGNWIIWGNVIYSLKICQDSIEQQVEDDGTTYVFKLVWTKSMNQQDPELNQFYSIMFKSMMKRVKFEQIGRNCYNPAKMV